MIRSKEETDVYGIPVGGYGDELPRGVRIDTREISVVAGSDDDCQLVFAKPDRNQGTTEGTATNEAIAAPAPSLSEPSQDVSAASPGPSSHPGISDLGHTDDEEEVPAIPSGRSIAHTKYSNREAVLLSLDIETAGEYVGIVQLSAEICRLDLVPRAGSNSKDEAANVRREGETFNEYVKPETEYEWDKACTDVHGLHPNHPAIIAAAGITDVWVRFTQWLCRHVKSNESVILVAWNGENCDLKWLWKLTQAPRSQLKMPSQIEYFVNSYRVISKYTSC